MRPLRLEIEAFGSFPGREVVDFEELAGRGLFVVTGPTGSGKTTIFDAMVFALYGELPGSRDVGDVRSHHAAAETSTQVQFDFEVDGASYRVTRNPRYDRPKLRGSGVTTESANAVLVRLDGATTGVASGDRACRQKCIELVGLEKEQFERVVLLPQGQFNRFLDANEGEREKLLRRLFGGEIFEQLVERLKDRSRKLEGEVAESERTITTALRSAWTAVGQARSVLTAEATVEVDEAASGEPDIESEDSEEMLPGAAEITDELASIAGERDVLAEQAAAAEKSAIEARAAATRATELAGRLDRANSLRDRLAELEARAAATEADRARLDRSRIARPVVAADAEAREAEQKARDAGARLEPLRDRVIAVLRELSCPSAEVPEPVPAAVATEIEQARADHRAQVEALEALARAARAVEETTAARELALEECRRTEAELAEAKTERERAEAAVAAARPAAGRGEAAQRGLAEAEQRRADRRELEELRRGLDELEARSRRAHDEYLDVMAAYVASEAPRLAEGLVPGEPCSVCGSPEHPRPAVADDGALLASHADVEEARRKWSEADRGQTAQVTKIRTKAAALGAASDTALDEFDEAVAVAEQAVTAAEEADNALEEAEQAAKAAAAREDAVVVSATRAAQALAEIDGRLRSEGETKATAAKAVEGIDPDRVTAVGRVFADLDGLVEHHAAAVADATAAEARRSSATDRLGSVLAESSFDTVESARSELLSVEEEQDAEVRISTWQTDIDRAKSGLAVLEGLGLPDERPDAEALGEAAGVAESTRDALRGRVTAIDVHLANGRNALADAAREEAESGSRRSEVETVRRVYETCAGRGGLLKASLDRWVLGGELELVASAGNVHLARMTAHRYDLRRDGSKELGLVIFDAHSGRERPTGTLSGGEKFQVSLALALGLADVVSMGGAASGRVYKALFVDEGFGSLDPEALDQAVAALVSLQAGGRMVGAITHVEAMKQQLHVGIEVRRREGGAGSTLMVYP